MKTYFDFMNEISADELYDGLLGYGMFCEKLPPVFTSVQFLNYCKTTPGFGNKWQDYISFNSMRNINIPRLMGIPAPFQYEKLCRILKKNWPKLLRHFQDYTRNQTYPVSRIHIRKIYDKETHELKPELFEMNYKNWRNDGSPDDDLLITNEKVSKYTVHADISTCFPSIYSHTLPWALAGKDTAKSNIGKDTWYNKIDKACQSVRNGETHGLMIGPHSSNLLSEIILVVVDKKLWDAGYRFYRNIDDYVCYVESYEEAQRFLNHLEYELRQFDLPLNHKKTKIEELPKSRTEQWVYKVNSIPLLNGKGETDYKVVDNYLDRLIVLADEYNDSAVIKYGIKKLSDQKTISSAGKKLASKRLLHLAILRPYLVSLIDKYVIDAFDTDVAEIEAFVNALYKDSVRIQNYEGIWYALFFSVKYKYDIVDIDCDKLISYKECLVLVFLWLYYRKRGGPELAKLEVEALLLKNTDMDRYWLFVYEALKDVDLPAGDWKRMKKKGISFIIPGI